MRIFLPILSVYLGLACSALTWAEDDVARAGAALDAFHQAASDADLDAYLGLMTEDVVFLGTDGTERWQGAEFTDFVRPYFEAGRGWTYQPTERHLVPAASGEWIGFDELLQNEKLGQCRGSGILVKQQGRWKVAQYNLSVPVPNDIVVDVAQRIRGQANVAPVAEQASTAEPEGVSEQQSASGSEQPTEPEKRCPKRHKTNRAAEC